MATISLRTLTWVVSLSLLALLASAGPQAFKLPSGAEELLKSAINTNFQCENREYGYYADVSNGCQIFHVCLPREGRPTSHWSFVCNNGTIFDQQTLSCNYESDAFPCSEAESLYGLVDFGRIEK